MSQETVKRIQDRIQAIDNKALLAQLFPPMDIIMNAPLADDGNAIVQITAILYARPGGGKTTTVKWLVKEAKKFYGEDNVSACWAKGDMKLLLKGGFEKLPINILVGEDMTNYPFGQWEKWAFFNIRHLMKEATGLSRGLCLILLDVHDIYRIPKEFRLDSDITILKNCPSNDYEEGFYTRKIGREMIDFLKENEDKWIKDLSLKRFGAWYSHASKGYLEAEFIKEPNMVHLEWEDQTPGTFNPPPRIQR